MPWKCMLCGCEPSLRNTIRTRSPSVDAQGRAGHAAVVGPGREEHARRDLDLLVLGDDLELAHASGRPDPRDACPYPSRSGSCADRSRCAHRRPRRRSSCRRARHARPPFPSCMLDTGCAAPNVAGRAPADARERGKGTQQATPEAATEEETTSRFGPPHTCSPGHSARSKFSLGYFLRLWHDVVNEADQIRWRRRSAASRALGSAGHEDRSRGPAIPLGGPEKVSARPAPPAGPRRQKTMSN